MRQDLVLSAEMPLKQGRLPASIRVQLVLGNSEQRGGDAFTCMSELVKLQADR